VTGPGAIPPPVLRTRRLLLRPPAAADLTALLAFLLLERGEMRPFVPRRPDAYYTTAFQRRNLRALEKDRREDRGLVLLLFDRDRPGEVLGRITFSRFVRGAFQAAGLGYSLAAPRRGKGLMTEALRAALGYAFGPLGLHRVEAAHMPRNRASGRVLRRLGFRREGLARGYLLIAGRWEDHVLTALVNPRRCPAQPRAFPRARSPRRRSRRSPARGS